MAISRAFFCTLFTRVTLVNNLLVQFERNRLVMHCPAATRLSWWWRYKLRKINLKRCKSSLSLPMCPKPQKYEAQRNKIITNYIPDRYMFNWLLKFALLTFVMPYRFFFSIVFWWIFYSLSFFALLQFHSRQVSVASVRWLVLFAFMCVRVSVRVRQIVGDAKTVKSVHWVCNIYYGWWWEAVPFILCMHKTINNNMEKPPVCHSRGEVKRRNKVETVYSHTHTHKQKQQPNWTAPHRTVKNEIESVRDREKVEKNWRKKCRVWAKRNHIYILYIRFAILDPWPNSNLTAKAHEMTKPRLRQYISAHESVNVI